MYIRSLNAFGFLGGKEIKEAGLGNLGLQDRELLRISASVLETDYSSKERTALRWVHKFISAFGGDPSKVTMWVARPAQLTQVLTRSTAGERVQGLYRSSSICMRMAATQRVSSERV